MTLEVISFILGAILLAISLLGGGIESKGFKVPEVNRFSRIISGCLGFVFILLGLWIGGVMPLWKVPKRVTVPDVIGETESQAITLIEGAGLSKGSVSSRIDAATPGTVIEQQPAAGEQVSQDTAIALVLAEAEPLVTVPSVIGQTESQAIVIIEGAGLSKGSVTSRIDAATPGTVIEQQPAAGGQVSQDTAIALVLAEAEPLVTVPSVIGQTESQAIAIIEGAGLSKGSVTSRIDAATPGTVIEQQPMAGARVSKGTGIALVLAERLPDLIIESLTHSPANPTTADTITFTAVVKNAGSGAAGPSTLALKVGGETNPKTYPVPDLGPGQAYRIQRTEILRTAQRYLNTATADFKKEVRESDETNNQKTDKYQVGQAVSERLPDLYVSEFSLTPEVPVQGQPVRVRIGVYNKGVNRAGPFTVQWFAGENFPGPAKEWELEGMAARGGRILDYTYSGYRSWYAQIRTKVVIDPGNEVRETDKSNNVFLSTIRVQRQ